LRVGNHGAYSRTPCRRQNRSGAVKDLLEARRVRIVFPPPLNLRAHKLMVTICAGDDLLEAAAGVSQNGPVFLLACKLAYVVQCGFDLLRQAQSPKSNIGKHEIPTSLPSEARSHIKREQVWL